MPFYFSNYFYIATLFPNALYICPGSFWNRGFFKGDNMVIEILLPQFLSQTVALQQQIVPYPIDLEKSVALCEAMQHQPGSCVLVAREGNTIIGTVSGFCCRGLAGSFLAIEDLIVEETHRGSGIGGKLMDAIHATVNCMVVVAFAGIFGTLATNYNMSKVILNLASVFMGNKYIIMLFISAILFVAGMFIDSNAAMLMLVPVFSPLILQYGFDPIYFAMVCILTLDMGGMSPPVGLLMYIASSITDTPLAKTVKQIWQFLFVNYGVTILVIFVPAIVTLLPALFG